LFSAPADLSALRDLCGDRGARQLLRREGAPVLSIPAERAGHDIDDESDWRRWQETVRRG
jgi:CTP:molybdopterin cytidylyltransferase MocA